MPFSVSPSVTVTELDQSSIIPQLATTVACFVGRFDKGPVDEIVDITSEKQLHAIFGSPSAGERGTDWWTCANFLNYSDKLKVVRVAEYGTSYDTVGQGGQTAAQVQKPTGATLGARVEYKEPGVIGNSLRMVVWPAGVPNPVIQTGKGGLGGAFNQTEWYGDDPVDLFSYTPSTTEAVHDSWKAGVLASGSATTGFTLDEVHVALIDHKGLVGSNQGITGTVLEKWEGLSMWRGAYDNAGRNLYYKDVINQESNYVKIEEAVDRSIFHAWGKASNATGGTGGDPLWTPSTTTVPFYMNMVNAGGSQVGGDKAPTAYNVTFGGGSDGGVTWPYEGAGTDSAAIVLSNPHRSQVIQSYRKHFRDAEKVDIDLVLGGAAESTIATELVDMAESRKDCVVFLSPASSPSGAEYNDVVYQSDLSGYSGPTNLVNYRKNTLNKNSSYAVMDSGWKYMYDSYNGIFRWVPLNADVAGLVARTEQEQAAWYSPAGFNRGRIQGVVKLAINPSQAERDILYSNGINPVVSFPGEGTVLFGDKTMQRRASALDRINVRRLMIHLEKAISTAAKFQLFEFNDVFTRRAFVSTITPFLRRVQAQRGITDFRVVCDETNNTAEVIGANQFVADIFIKPAMSTNFINLNFVAVRQDAVFTETL